MKIRMKPERSLSLICCKATGGMVLAHISGIFLVLFVLFGCYNGSGSGRILQHSDAKLAVQHIAIVPFQQNTPEQIDINAMNCRHCGFFTRVDLSPDHPETILELMLTDKLDALYKVNVIPSDRVAGMYQRYSGDFEKVSPLELLKRVGHDLNADGIVFGYVYRYRERQGTPYAATKPASTAFEIHLYRVSDGSLIWKGSYDRTQTSLMENVLQASSFMRGGGRWVSVKELSEDGMDSILKSFPALHK